MVFQWITGRFRCLAGKHERSYRHVRKDEEGNYTSICVYCRAPMQRRAKRDWVVAPRR